MGYENFDVAIFCTAFDVISIENMEWFEQRFNFIKQHIKLSKVYIETFRSGKRVDIQKLLAVKSFFATQGIEVSGAITPLPRSDPDLCYTSFCYNNPIDCQMYIDIVKYTAQNFDEIIIDDFFFTNCKCERCIEAKGALSWDSYRTEMLGKFSREIVSAAKSVNSKVNFIIKYPNWYEEYQNTGYNLKEQPYIFDMIYTGTETRDPQNTQQHLQRYLSYFIMRYMENIKPGKNGGGWFDGIDCTYNANSYAQQAYLTLFSKAREVTLFCMSLLCAEHSMFIPIAGYVFDRVDAFYSRLGNPVGVACYKPYNSKGEGYLHNYIGMLGIPLEPSPEFSYDSESLFLTESAASDAGIIDKLKARLNNGNDVIVTSGFINATKDAGIDDIIQFSCSGKKSLVDTFAYNAYECSFQNYCQTSQKLMLPQIEYPINDVWTIVAGISENNNFPVLVSSQYGKGIIYVLTVPDDYGQMYSFPREVLAIFRKVFCKGMTVSVDAPSKVGIFVYDNNTFIIQSFLPYNTDINICINRTGVTLQSLEHKYQYTCARKIIEGVQSENETIFTVKLRAGALHVYSCQQTCS